MSCQSHGHWEKDQCGGWAKWCFSQGLTGLVCSSHQLLVCSWVQLLFLFPLYPTSSLASAEDLSWVICYLMLSGKGEIPKLTWQRIRAEIEIGEREGPAGGCRGEGAALGGHCQDSQCPLPLRRAVPCPGRHRARGILQANPLGLLRSGTP